MSIDIYSLNPVNKTASLVTSQRGVSNEDCGASPHEIDEQRAKMIANRRKELGEFLGITTKAQRRNHMYRIATRASYIATHRYPDLLLEWYKIGKESFRLTESLRLRKLGDRQ
jgi:hypothetical protein